MSFIGDLKLLFATNVGDGDIQVVAKTVIANHDTGEWSDLAELKAYIELSFEKLKTTVEKQTEEVCKTIIAADELGTKTTPEAFGKIIPILIIILDKRPF